MKGQSVLRQFLGWAGSAIVIIVLVGAVMVKIVGPDNTAALGKSATVAVFQSLGIGLGNVKEAGPAITEGQAAVDKAQATGPLTGAKPQR